MKENYFFHSDLKVVLVVVVPAILERFTFFLTGLIDLDNSAILIFFEYFSKDSYMFKNVVSKNKANYKLMLLVHKEKKIIKKLSRSILQKFLFKYCASLIETLQHRHFW